MLCIIEMLFYLFLYLFTYLVVTKWLSVISRYHKKSIYFMEIHKSVLFCVAESRRSLKCPFAEEFSCGYKLDGVSWFRSPGPDVIPRSPFSGKQIHTWSFYMSTIYTLKVLVQICIQTLKLKHYWLRFQIISYFMWTLN